MEVAVHQRVVDEVVLANASLRKQRPNDLKKGVSPLGETPEEVPRGQRPSFGQLNDVLQRHVTLTPLDASNIVAMEISAFCQLGNSPSLRDILAKSCRSES
jgi:hypothetical protein